MSSRRGKIISNNNYNGGKRNISASVKKSLNNRSKLGGSYVNSSGSRTGSGAGGSVKLQRDSGRGRDRDRDDVDAETGYNGHLGQSPADYLSNPHNPHNPRSQRVSREQRDRDRDYPSHNTHKVTPTSLRRDTRPLSANRTIKVSGHGGNSGGIGMSRDRDRDDNIGYHQNISSHHAQYHQNISSNHTRVPSSSYGSGGIERGGNGSSHQERSLW